MHDHRQKYFLSFLPKPISVIALILAISGHFYILHAINRLTYPDNKSRGVTSKIAVNLLSGDTAKKEKAPRLTMHHQDEQNLTSREHHTSSTTQSFDEITIDAQPSNESYYYKSDELSQKPQLINDLPADFSLADIAELPEPLIMTLRISNEGIVDEVLLAADITDNQTLQLISNAFKAMSFTAAKIADIAVPSEMRIEVWKNSANQDEQTRK